MENRSFKVMGRIGEKEAVVLIDTGAEVNFLSQGLALQLKLTIEESPFLVEVGTRHTSHSSGIYPRVELVIQGATIVEPFFLVGLRRVDIVFGYGWIEGLGDIYPNFQQQQI